MMKLQPIAIYRSPLTSKFGIPKQSGLVKDLVGRIVFEKPFRNFDYIRGIDGFDYLWLVWCFSENKSISTSPVVRPPLLGGNKKVGVFASRSPYRPNPIGLSSVKLVKVEWESDNGPILHVKGGDLLDKTPIYDIKPYIEYCDSHTNVRCGFVDLNIIKRLNVIFSDRIKEEFDNEKLNTLAEILSLDPRPHYHNDDKRIYGMDYDNYDVMFRVLGETLLVEEMKKK